MFQDVLDCLTSKLLALLCLAGRNPDQPPTPPSMSLTNSMIVGPLMNSNGVRPKYSVSLGDLIAGGAFATVDIILARFPAGAMLQRSRIKHEESVDGTAFSASTARLYFGKSGSLGALGAGALDVFAATGSTDGTHSITSTTQVAGDLEDENLLVMRVTSTGGNLEAATAGIISAVADVADLSI